MTEKKKRSMSNKPSDVPPKHPRTSSIDSSQESQMGAYREETDSSPSSDILRRIFAGASSLTGSKLTRLVADLSSENETSVISALSEMNEVFLMAPEGGVLGFPVKNGVPALLALMEEEDISRSVLAARVLGGAIESVPAFGTELSKERLDDLVRIFSNTANIELAEVLIGVFNKLISTASNQAQPAIAWLVLVSGGVHALLSKVEFFSSYYQDQAFGVVKNIIKSAGLVNDDCEEDFCEEIDLLADLLDSRIQQNYKSNDIVESILALLNICKRSEIVKPMSHKLIPVVSKILLSGKATNTITVMLMEILSLQPRDALLELLKDEEISKFLVLNCSRNQNLLYNLLPVLRVRADGRLESEKGEKEALTFAREISTSLKSNEMLFLFSQVTLTLSGEETEIETATEVLIRSAIRLVRGDGQLNIGLVLCAVNLVSLRFERLACVSRGSKASTAPCSPTFTDSKIAFVETFRREGGLMAVEALLGAIPKGKSKSWESVVRKSLSDLFTYAKDCKSIQKPKPSDTVHELAQLTAFEWLSEDKARKLLTRLHDKVFLNDLTNDDTSKRILNVLCTCIDRVVSSAQPSLSTFDGDIKTLSKPLRFRIHRDGHVFSILANPFSKVEDLMTNLRDDFDIAEHENLYFQNCMLNSDAILLPALAAVLKSSITESLPKQKTSVKIVSFPCDLMEAPIIQIGPMKAESSVFNLLFNTHSFDIYFESFDTELDQDSEDDETSEDLPESSNAKLPSKLKSVDRDTYVSDSVQTIINQFILFESEDSDLAHLLFSVKALLALRPSLIDNVSLPYVSAKATELLSCPFRAAVCLQPDWLVMILTLTPFLLPLEGRRFWFNCMSVSLPLTLGIEKRQAKQKLLVNRTQIVIGAAQAMTMNVQSGKGCLEIGFKGDVGTGTGPTNEFYALVASSLTQEKTGLFKKDSQGLLFPTVASISAEDYMKFNEQPELVSGSLILPHNILGVWKMLGRLTARCLLDSRLLDLELHPVFWDLFKIIKKDEVSFCCSDALRELDPVLQKSLTSLRSLGAGELAGLGIDTKTLPGSNFKLSGIKGKTLTRGNLESYISEVTSVHVLHGVYWQVYMFKEGFNDLLDSDMLYIFTSSEISSLFVGGSLHSEEHWSSENIQSSFVAAHGYSKDSSIFVYLSEVLSEMTITERMSFVRFITGARSLPRGGFASLSPPLTVVRTVVDKGSNIDAFLPSVMTCANFLKIPDYSSKQVLHKQLLRAIKDGLGSFDLS